MTTQEVTIAQSTASQPIISDTELIAYESALLKTFDLVGLPSQGVLAPVNSRARVFKNIEDTLEPIDSTRRKASLYLSKFLAAVSAGLFDAALNYLWDETVGELRNRITAYDLSYFFDLAVGSASEQRKHLNSAEDLIKVTDQNLLDAARQLGLISDVGYQQLDLVRYMRNHASAAHPNQNDLRATQLLDYLEVCINEVICLPQTEVVIQIGRLLKNIKTERLSRSDISTMAATFGSLTEDQATNLGDGLGGIYTRLDSDPQTRDNIRMLLPKLWPYLPESSRSQFGVRALRFRVNGDKESATLAIELLDAVDGQGYLPDDLLIPYVQQTLESLREAHAGWNNFSNEALPAKELARVVGNPPNVPSSLENEYVKTLVKVFLTNGHGESWEGDPIYKSLIESFTPRQASVALYLIMTQPVAAQLHRSLSVDKWQELMEIIEPKLVNRPAKQLLDALYEYTPPLYTVRQDTDIRKLAKDLRAVL